MDLIKNYSEPHSALHLAIRWLAPRLHSVLPFRTNTSSYIFSPLVLFAITELIKTGKIVGFKTYVTFTIETKKFSLKKKCI